MTGETSNEGLTTVSNGEWAVSEMASIAFRSDLDFQDKIERMLTIGRQRFDADAGVLASIRDDLFKVEYAVVRQGKAPIGFECDVRETLCHETIRQKTALAIEDIAASNFRTHPSHVKYKVGAYIGAIVWVNGKKYGTLCFNGGAPRSEPYTDADKQFIHLMALWTGGEIERRQLIEDLESRVEERSQALVSKGRVESVRSRIGIAIRASLNPEEIQNRAAELLGEALDADRCFFGHFDLEVDHLRLSEDYRRPELRSLAGDYKPSDFGIDLVPLFEAGRTLVIRDIESENWPARTVEMFRSLEIRSLVDVPVTRENNLEAVLCVAMTQPRDWTAEEVALIETVLAQTVTAVDSAAVIQRERRIATTLQEMLLPRLPQSIPGMTLGYEYRAALEESSVGGDFYAVYPIDERRWALVIGDVSGKGLAAASYVAALQNMLRYALCASHTVDDAVGQMNAIITNQSILAGFATLFVGAYDTADKTLTYCSCGHEPPLVVAGRVVKPLKTTGPPIGIAAGVRYVQQCIQLAVGDVLVLYTDGLAEAGPDRRNLLGLEGLTRIVRRRVGGHSVATAAADIVSDVAAFANGRLRDDACLVVARVTDEYGSAVESGTGFTTAESTLESVHPEKTAPSAQPGSLSGIAAGEQFRLLVDSVTEYAIFLLDETGHILTWNTGAARLKGYSASEIIGKHFSIFYTMEDVQRNHPLNELAIAVEEGRYEEEGWRIRKDGTRFWANVLITALKDADGNLIGFAKVTRDITERKQAEELRLQTMRDQISRSFLRDILFSVTEGRLRFCEDESQLPQRLETYVPVTPFGRGGLADIRNGIVVLATAMAFKGERIDDLVTAASEAAMNAVVHAKRASYAIYKSDDTIQVWIVDNGSGIEITKLHRATLERGFTTENSLGHGFWLMLHTCDRLWLRSSSTGTTVVLEQDAIAPEPEWLSRPRGINDYLDRSEDAA